MRLMYAYSVQQKYVANNYKFLMLNYQKIFKDLILFKFLGILSPSVLYFKYLLLFFPSVKNGSV